MTPHETLILSRSEVARLLTIEESIAAVEGAFRLYAEGKAEPPHVSAIHGRYGAFHIKSGIMDLGESFFVTKTNANYPQNPIKNGLPTIQGVVAVFNASDGRLLCLMDSMELTTLRTGAATAVAAKYLSRKNSKVATIWGCGVQGRISARMIASIRPLEKIFFYDVSRTKAEAAVKDLSQQLMLELCVSDNPLAALGESDICVTCTPANRPVVKAGQLPRGIFLAAVGADNEHKQEVDPALMKSSKVVVDLADQASKIGDLHHAIEAGLMSTGDIHAELGEVITRKKPGRTSDDEIIIFDSTGMALQDVATAAIVYRKAAQSGRSTKVAFGA